MFIIWYKFFLIKCTKYIYWQLCPCTKVLKYLYNFFKFIYIYFYKIFILWYMHEKMLHSLSQENYAIHDSFFFENRRVYICLDRKKNDITIRACYTDSAFQRWYQAGKGFRGLLFRVTSRVSFSMSWASVKATREPRSFVIWENVLLSEERTSEEKLLKEEAPLCLIRWWLINRVIMALILHSEEG